MRSIFFTWIGLFLFNYLAVSQIVNDGNAGNWENIGPFGDPEVHWTATGNGALDYVEMHPTNPAIMYVAARNGGLWRTTNYGANWTPITDYFDKPYCSCVEVCKANPNILYMGAKQDAKVWYSSNSGASWTNRSSGMGGTIHEIHSDPSNAARVLAATESGIYLSTNSGQSWTQKLSGNYSEIDSDDDWDLLLVSKNNVSGNSIIQYSRDKGNTWTDFTVSTASASLKGKAYTAIYEQNNNIQVFVYGIKKNNIPTRFIGLWKSNYSATGTPFTFTRVQHSSYNYPDGPVPLVVSGSGYKPGDDNYGGVNPYETTTWVGDFFVDPNNPNNMLTCREKLWGSKDGGIIWEFKPSYGESNWADNRYITTNITKDTIYWCNDGGLWSISITDMFSGNNPNKVVPKNGDICVTEGSQMDVSLQNKNCFITGGQDIGQIFVRNGRDSHVASADVYRGRIKPNDDSKFITGALKINLGGTQYDLYNNIEADYHNADRLYGFTRGTVKLARSPSGSNGWNVVGFIGENQANTGGHSWTPVNPNWQEVNTGISNLRAGTFEQSRANANVAFIGDEVGQKLYITNNLSNASVSWTLLPNAPALTKYRIATHANNVNVVAIASDNKVYLSTDKGVSWIEKTGFPGVSVVRVIIDKTTAEGIYVATTKTVYYTDETLSAWIDFNKGLPFETINDLRIAYYSGGDNNLFVSKYGRGVWRSPLYSAGPVSNIPMAMFSGTPTTVAAGGSVSFTDASTNTPTSWSWTFTGGSPATSSAQNPTITYNTPGTYQVALTATNADGSDSETKASYITVVSGDPVISQSAWTLHYADSEETAGENGAAINAFDGNASTIWHTEWSASSPAYPHEIQINLGASYALTELRYLPRQNGPNTRIANYEIYVSTDGSTWGTAVATGTWPNATTEQIVPFSAKTGQYIRLVGLTAANGTNFAGAAEINVYGTSGSSPAVPVAAFNGTPTTVTAGGTVSLTDASTNTPTSWSWTFTGGTPSASTAQNPTVTYNTAGTYPVALTATNSTGSDVETKAAYIVVTGGTPTYCASKGNSVSEEWIASVVIGSFTNTSTADGGYKDNTSQTITLAPGASSGVTLTPGFSGTTYTEHWRIWIDFNADGDFTDLGEELYSGNGRSAVSGSITIPSSASGTTRMRVSMKYDAAPTTCEIFSYGEVEDYTVSFGGAKSALIANVVENENLGNKMTAYPNPSFGDVDVSLTDKARGKILIRVLNLSGQLVYQNEEYKGSDEFNTTINLKDIDRNMYILQLISNGETYNTKILLINPPNEHEEHEK